MSTQVMPNAEAGCIDWLAAQPELVALIGDRVASEKYDGEAYPFLTVTKITGTGESWHWIEQAQIELMSWTAKGERDAAHEICATALALLHDLPMDETDAVITAVRDVVTPHSLPDPETGAPRFRAEVLVTLHPRPVIGS